jgi:LPS export ABC transporter protein LptC/lipopolysaccharide transport protein LptA
MGNRKIVIYLFIGCIIASLLLALYFFVRKPDRIIPPVVDEEKKVIVFKEVKYSGEKKGVIDWEIKAKIARKYIDKPLIELETLTGQYKPKDGVVVQFKGTKGSMDTDKENGSVENVDVLYKNEYTLKSTYMDFDFKNGTTTTKAPVNIAGNKLTMRGIGLTANTRQETVKLESDVSGVIETEKARYKFQADTLIYHFKDDMYILQGKVVFKGEDMSLDCGKLLIYSSGQELERVEAYDKVNIISKGTVAKSEKAVYHFKEGKIVFTNSPRVFKDNAEMRGESIEYNTGNGNVSVNQPKIRLNK